MSGYVVANFDVTDIDAYEGYVPGVIPTLEAHGAKVLAPDYHSETLDGSPGRVTFVIRFTSKDAARAWYDSPEYQEIVHLRIDNSTGFTSLADEIKMPRSSESKESYVRDHTH